MEKDNISHRDMLFVDFPEFKVTEKTKQDVNAHPEKYYQCGYRIANGMFCTDEERNRYFEESLKRALPGDDTRNPVLRKDLKQSK